MIGIRKLLYPACLALSLTTLTKAQVINQWTDYFNTGSTSSSFGAKAIGRDGADNVYVCGSVPSAGGSYINLEKIDPTGLVVWSKQYSSGAAFTQPTAMVVDDAGNAFITGNFGPGSSTQIFTLEIDPNGNALWTKKYVGVQGVSYAHGIAIDSNEDVYVTGFEERTATLEDLLLIKYHGADGSGAWSRTLDGSGNLNDEGGSVIVDGDDNVIVTGSAYRTAQDLVGWLVKYQSDGTFLWQRQMGTAYPNHPLNIGPATLGPLDTVIVAGSTYNGVDNDAIVFAWDHNGNYVWSTQYDSGHGDDILARAAASSDGTVTVVGSVPTTSQGRDILIMRFDAAGNKLWSTTYNGPASSDDVGRFITYDSNRQPIVFGSEQGVGTNQDLSILKFDRNTGALVWHYGFDGPNSYKDNPVDICYGPSGELNLLGYQVPSGNVDTLFEIFRLQQNPVANPDSYDVGEGGNLNIPYSQGVLINDEYGGVGNGTASLATQAGHGMANLNADGSFTYAPNQGFYGQDSFTYKLTRNGYQSNVATVTITVDPVLPKTLTANPTTVNGGFGTTATVTLTSPAPTGGITVNCSSNSLAVIVPPTCTIAAGATTATFPVGTNNVSVQSIRSFSVSRAGVTKTANITINPSPTLTSIVIYPDTVVGGSATTGKVTLTGPAPQKMTVGLSDNSSAVNTPLSVDVLKGNSFASFPIGTSIVSSQATRTVSATLFGLTKSASITLLPIAPASLTINPSTVKGGQSTTGTVTLNIAAPNGGFNVALSDNSSVVNTPGSVLVPAGATQASFTITTFPVGVVAVRTVSATTNGVTKTATITITP